MLFLLFTLGNRFLSKRLTGRLNQRHQVNLDEKIASKQYWSAAAFVLLILAVRVTHELFLKTMPEWFIDLGSYLVVAMFVAIVFLFWKWQSRLNIQIYNESFNLQLGNREKKLLTIVPFVAWVAMIIVFFLALPIDYLN